jgi:DNA-binding GntR family transcriptional regulator
MFWAASITSPDTSRVLNPGALIEALYVPGACKYATPEEALRLEAVYEEMERCARANDSKGVVNADVEFHKLIWEFTRNPFLEAALKRAILPYFAYVSIRLASRPTHPERDAYSHRGLVAVIKNNDVQGARRAFEQSFGSWVTSESGKHEGFNVDAAPPEA